MVHGFGYVHGGYNVQQYGTVVLSTGQRKQLNLLLEDRHHENCKTYNWADSPSGYSLSSRRAATAPNGSGEPTTGDEELTYKVNNKRTPSGNFFQTINTALVEKQSPPNYYQAEDITKSAATTLRSSRMAQAGHLAAHSSVPPSPDGSYHGSDVPSPSGAPAMYQFSSPKGETSVHQAAMGGSGSLQRTTSWMMPWQTGDRATGRRVADMVRSKRTPSGNFSVLSLAKPNK